MKKYVFFASSICNMGGQEQYLNNKSKRLLANGFDVYIFSYANGNVLLNGLKRFKSYINPILRLEPYLYKPCDMEKYLSWLEHIVKPKENDVYVESTVAPQAEWGELFSERICAKHIIIDLQEQHNYSQGLRSFLKFKYDRGELFGITSKSIMQILGLECNDDLARKSYIAAECGGVIQEIDNPIIDKFKSKEINIGSIGRLDKPYVIPMIKDIVSFAKIYCDKSIGLLLIGGGSKEIERFIQSEIEKARNISLVITGYLYPIPERLVRKINCFICTAGSAYETMRYGCPTIVYSMSSYKPLGIFDYTVKDITQEDAVDECEMQDLLEQILFNDFCSTHPSLGMRENKIDFEKEYHRQISFFEFITKMQYYDVSKIITFGTKEYLYRFVSFIVGAKCFEFIQRKMGSVRKKLKV